MTTVTTEKEGLYDSWGISGPWHKPARIIVTILLCLIAFYFRTFLFFEKNGLSSEKAYAIAENMVKAKMAEQIKAQLPTEVLQDPQKLQIFLRDRVEQIAEQNKLFYLQAVEQAQKAVMGAHATGSGKHYLLEADPYFYLYLTENVLRTGKVAEKMSSGLYLNPLRMAPDGRWDRFNLSPYFGAAVYKVIHFFNPAISLMEALNWVPLLLVLITVIIQQLCYALLRFGAAESFLGGFLFVLAPVFLQRSVYGWYDTDPWIFLFSIPITALFLKSILSSGHCRWLIGVSAVLSALFIFFWSGCSFLFCLITGVGLGVSVVCCFRDQKQSKDVFQKTIFYLAVALAAFLIIVPSKLLGDTFSTGLSFLFDAASPDAALWPSGLMTTGETKSTTLLRLVFLTGSVPSAILAFLGFMFLWAKVFKEKGMLELKTALFLSGMTFPLLLLGVRIERFSLLLVIVLCFWYPCGLYLTSSFLSETFARLINSKNSLRIKRIVSTLLIVFSLPMILITSHYLASSRQTAIMNDAWYEVLKEAERITPENAIIHSWWPPGHFITGVAHRRVVIDGGSQELPQVYWMARALMTDNEEQSVGLMRMISTSGNRAYEFLREKGHQPSEAVHILATVAALSKEKAKGSLSPKFSDADIRSLLSLTHGNQPPSPSYFLLYNEMVEQNLAITIVSQWDFDLAEKVLLHPKKSFQFSALLSADPGEERLKTILGMNGGILKYEKEGTLVKQEGDKLYFDDGLMVDLKAKDALVNKGGGFGKPQSLFYETENGFEEKPFTGRVAEVSALIFQKNGRTGSVLAHRKLIRSVLFRLYYLNGKGLKLFRPIIERKEDSTATVVKLFSIEDPELKGVRNE